MQLTLGFLDQSNPPAVPWEGLDDDARSELLNKLANLIVRAKLHGEDEEARND